MRCLSLLLLTLIPTGLLAEACWFSRTQDYLSWRLSIDGEHFEVERCSVGGVRTKADGIVSSSVSAVEFTEKAQVGQRSVLREKRFLKKCLYGTLYLVEEQRLEEFDRIGRMPDGFLRSTSLDGFFHEIAAPEKEDQANQGPNGTSAKAPPSSSSQEAAVPHP